MEMNNKNLIITKTSNNHRTIIIKRMMLEDLKVQVVEKVRVK